MAADTVEAEEEEEEEEEEGEEEEVVEAEPLLRKLKFDRTRGEGIADSVKEAKQQGLSSLGLLREPEAQGK
ncbi:unnamed protein product [Effrenium voratum]|nr:unnamed protein product [Effrenium voratum]